MLDIDETKECDDQSADGELFAQMCESGELARLRKEVPAYSLSNEAILAIPTDTFLRRDSTQVVLYGRIFLDVWAHRLTAMQAMALALFDGSRTLGDVARVFQQHSGGGEEYNWFRARRVLAFLKVGEPSNEFEMFDRRDSPSREFRVFRPGDFHIPEEKHQTRIKLDAPISLLLMPTSVCATNCIYCYATRRPIDKRDLLPLGRIKELLDEAARIGVCVVNLDGGDALVREDIVEIIAHTESHGIQADVSTKAVVSKELARRLYDAGVRRIQFGFDAPFPALFDEAVGRPGHFAKTITSIYNCAEAGIIPRTNSILTRRSFKYIRELVSLLHGLPIRDMKITPMFRSLHRPDEDIMLRRDEKAWLRQQIAVLEEQYPTGKIKFSCDSDFLEEGDAVRERLFEEFPRCGAGTETMIIAPDGRVVMCEQSPQDQAHCVGNVKTQSLLDVWNGDAMRGFRDVSRTQLRGTVCEDCSRFEECFHEKGGCFVLSVKAYGTRFAPHPACPKAPRYSGFLQ